MLILGESGTGKELVARAIHYSSSRASASFVPVNCGGIPEELLESELFGHRKRAFTGASESRAGFFQTADGGTIFLDEVGETSLAMQLLRVLQDREVCMLGDARPRKVNVRVMADRGAFAQAGGRVVCRPSDPRAAANARAHAAAAAANAPAHAAAAAANARARAAAAAANARAHAAAAAANARARAAAAAAIASAAFPAETPASGPAAVAVAFR
ncbi:MAG: sigma-54 factor interaction domain-containing protein, partial [Deltaproteobacteria bacterium]|nr:sigma-54 factor interaction domain-containing protein [Deltaproteobacteria bacterium]